MSRWDHRTGIDDVEGRKNTHTCMHERAHKCIHLLIIMPNIRADIIII